jgi:hypothetical protein
MQQRRDGWVANGVRTVGLARRGGVKKALLVVGVILLVLLVGAVAIAPSVLSSMAPGLIADAGKDLRGKLSVQKVSLGWFSPVEVESLKILDEKGEVAANVNVSSDATLSKVIGGRWWSSRSVDLGTIKVSGDLKVVNEPDGTSNLQRALESKNPPAPTSTPAPAAKPAAQTGPEVLKAIFKIDTVTATVKDRTATGFGPEQGIKGLAGQIALDMTRGGAIVAKGSFAGTPIQSGTAAGQAKIDIDANLKQGADGKVESGTAKLGVSGVPTALVDGIAGLGGALVKGAGPTLEVALDAGGTPTAGDAKVRLRSEGINGDLHLSLKDGVVTTAATGSESGANTVSVKSLEFLGLLPQLRANVAEAGKQVKLTQAPSLHVAIESLRVPIGTGGKVDVKTLDLRGAGAVLKARLSGMSGQVALDTDGSGGASAEWKPFAVQPTEVAVNAADLSQPVKITAGTTATLEGKSAGTIALDAAATGLLDGGGRLRAVGNAGFAESATADVTIAGMNTALVQPLAAGMGLPVELGTDVGPTLDLSLKAKADTASLGVAGAAAGGAGGGGTQQLPPIAATLAVKSANIAVDGAVRVDKGVVTTGDAGLVAKVNSAGPLVQRFLAKQEGGAPVGVSGRGGVEVRITGLNASLDGLKGAAPLKALAGVVDVAVEDLSVQPKIEGASGGPVQVQSSRTRVTLAPGRAPAVEGESNLAHGGAGFVVKQKLTVDGLASGAMPKASGLAMVDALAVSGTVDVKGLPRSLADLSPGSSAYGTGALPAGQAGKIADAVRAIVGPTVDLSVNLLAADAKDGGGRLTRVQVSPASKNASVDAWVRTSATAAEVRSLVSWVIVDPAKINPILAGDAPAGGKPPMKLEQGFKVYALIEQPALIPLKTGADGTVTPDFASAKSAVVKIPVEGDVVIGNVPGGAGGGQTARVTGLTMTAEVPLAGLGGPQAAATARAKAVASATIKDGRGAQAAVLAADVAAMMDGSSPEALVKLAQVNSGVVDGVLGRPGLVSGALGETADVTIQASPVAGGSTGRIELVSPKVTGAKLPFAQDAERIRLTGPATINWRPDASFLNGLLTSADGKPSALTVTQTAPVSMTINALSVAMSKSDASGKQTVGPLKPGIFEADVSITTPSVGLTVQQEGGAGGARPAPLPLTLEGVRIAARRSSEATPGIDADVAIEKIVGGANPGASSTITAKVSNLADVGGVLTPDAAVINADAKMVSFPTPLADELGNQKGLLTELLGPTIDLTLSARNLSKSGSGKGLLDATAVSPRATAKLRGDVRDGRFIQDGTVEASLIEIRPQLVQKLAGGVPLVETIEKTREDKPALMTTEGLTAPIDGDMRKLNGTVKVDLGVARFTTKSIMGDIIKAVGGKVGGSVGNRIEPFIVNIKEGVATYEQFKLPVGEFDLQTKGTVDLVQRRIDVVTYVPFFALTDEALGAFKVGFGGNLNVIDRNTLVPITTKGSLDNPKTQLDMGLFMKETGDRLIKDPGKIIGDVLGDLLKPKPKK